MKSEQKKKGNKEITEKKREKEVKRMEMIKRGSKRKKKWKKNGNKRMSHSFIKRNILE